MAGTSKSGRKPKPTSLKLLQGNAGKRKVNHDEPLANVLEKAPEPPAWMSARAQAQWFAVAEWLVGAKILAGTDLHLLEAYCVAYGHWRDANDHIAEHTAVLVNPTSGAFYKNPMVTVKNESEKQMTTSGSALGLDPASRSRLAVDGARDATNPFAALLGGKK